jgi:hypothetical protein
MSSHALVVNINEFSISRNGSLIFTDSFTDGNEPPSAPNSVSGNPQSYGVFGAFASNAETGGRLTLDSALGAQTANAVGDPRLNVIATWLTDTSSNLNVGLKSDDTLSISAIFSLTTPVGPSFNAYGIQVTDQGPGHPVQQILQVFVQFNPANPQPRIVFNAQDFDADTVTNVGAALLNPPAGADEILLTLSKPDAASDDFFASFAYGIGGVFGPSTQFANAGQMFQGEDFVRTRFLVAQDVPAIPEPSTWLLWLIGLPLAAVVALRRKPISMV